MSRIYQGGGAERRFQSNKQSRGFNPNEVKGEIKRIQQEGAAAIQDLQTQDRERLRDEQRSDLQRSSADRFAQLQLRQEQIQEQAAFKIQQTVDDFNLKNQQLKASQALQTRLTVDKNKLSSEQLGEKNALQMQQYADSSKFKLQQMGEQGYFKSQQMTEDYALKSQHIEENLELGMKSIELQANATREQAAMSSAFAQQNADMARAQAQLSKQQAGVNALLAFGNIAVKGAELGVQFAEQQEREAQKAADLEAFSHLFSGSTAATVANSEAAQNNIEIAEERGIQAVGANSIEREAMRQPMADQTMLRDIQQTEIGAAANGFQSQFDAYVNDPNTRALVNGEYRTRQSLNAQELTEWLTSAARDMTTAYGISGKEGYAAVMQYGTAVKNAINSQYATLAPGIRKMAKGNRWDAVTANANEVVAGGDYQRGYDLLMRGVYSSGFADNMTIKEAKDAAFEKLVSITPTEQLEQLKQVNSISGQPNTQFGNQREYVEKIDAEIARRNNAQFNLWNSGQKVTSIEITNIEQETLRNLLQPGADARAVRAEGIERLRALKTPQAFDAINRLMNEQGNPMVLAELTEAYDLGQPPSSERIQQELYRGNITKAQADALLKRGKTSSQISQTLSQSGLPEPRKMLESIASAAMGAKGIESDQQALLKDTVVNAELAYYENELNRIIINNPDAPASVIQQKVQELNVGMQKRLFDPNNQNASVFETNGSITTYKFGSKPPLAPIRRNASTGKAQRVYINHNVEQIASHTAGASVNDVYLTKDQFLAAMEVWDRGGSDYSPRIKAISKHLGVTPHSFIRRQSEAMGFGSIDKITPAQIANGNYAIDPELKDALNVLGKYESDGVGGYNAVNQGGRKGGTEALGYSGDSTKTTLFGGAVSEMSIAQVMARQATPAASQAEFEAKGGIHAAGRYQFIGKTLKWVVEQTGIDVNEKFSPEVQDYLAGWLLANSSNGIGQWIGPKLNASAQERAVVNRARTKLQDAYRVLRNPNAGQIQRQRAMRTVGNPFVAPSTVYASQAPRAPQAPQAPRSPGPLNPPANKAPMPPIAGIDAKTSGFNHRFGQGYLVIGDSLASGLHGWNYAGNNNSDAKVGRSPQEVLKHLQKYGAANLKGRHVVLSTGILNNTSDWPSIEYQLDLLKKSGATATILGVPNTQAYNGTRARLNALAKKYGFAPPQHFDPGADGVHPKSYLNFRF